MHTSITDFYVDLGGGGGGLIFGVQRIEVCQQSSKHTLQGSLQRMLERCNTTLMGAHFSFMWLKQCILIATRIPKSL